MPTIDSDLSVRAEEWLGRSRRLVSGIKIRSFLLSLLVPLCLFLFLFRSASEPIRLNWGDPMSDLNAMTAGRYFKDYGFLATRFTPILDVGVLTNKSLRYTHYPPLPDLVNGALQTLGVTKLVHFRYIALLFSALGIVALFGALNLIYGLEAAVWAIVLLTSNFLWLQYADSVHHFPLYFCFSSVALWCCTSWLTHKKNRFLVGLFASVALAYLSSYDVWFALPILAFASLPLMGRSFKEASSLRLLITAGAGACFGVGVKFGLVCWSYGSVSAFLKDLIFQSQERGLNHLSAGFIRSLILSLGGGIFRFFSPVFPVVTLIYLGLEVRRWRRKAEPQDAGSRAPTTSPLWFLAAGIPFLAAFPELTLNQVHPMAQLFLFYSVGTGVLLASLRSRGTSGKRTASAILLAALGWQVLEGTACRKFLVSEKSFHEMRTLADSVDSRLVLTDMPPIDSAIRYYVNRHPVFLQFEPPFSRVLIAKSILEREGSRSLLMLKYRPFTDAWIDQIYRRVPLVLLKRFGWYDYKPWMRRTMEQRAGELERFARAMGKLRAVLPEFEVYEITLASVQHHVDQLISSNPTAWLRFDGRADFDELHRVAGLWRRTGDDGPQPLWAGDRPIQKPVFTLQGMTWEPTERYQREDTEVRLKVTPGVDHHLALQLAATVPNQRLELFLDGHGVGSFELAEPVFALAEPEIPTTVYARLPSTLLPRDGLATLKLKFSKTDKKGRAATLLALSLVSANSGKARGKVSDDLGHGLP